MVAMRMAEVLKGLDTVLLPAGGEDGMNPLDLDRVLALFGVGDGSAPPPAPRAPEPAPAAATNATLEVVR